MEESCADFCLNTVRFSGSLFPIVCIYLNKSGSTGPHLDKKKIQRLPDHFGPARASVVLQQAVQACIDCAYHQKTVFSFLKQGHGGEVISGKHFQAVCSSKLSFWWSILVPNSYLPTLENAKLYHFSRVLTSSSRLFWTMCHIWYMPYICQE